MKLNNSGRTTEIVLYSTRRTKEMSRAPLRQSAAAAAQATVQTVPHCELTDTYTEYQNSILNAIAYRIVPSRGDGSASLADVNDETPC